MGRAKVERCETKAGGFGLSWSPHVVGWDREMCGLSNIYRPLFATGNQYRGEQSKSRDITRSMSQSDDGS